MFVDFMTAVMNGDVHIDAVDDYIDAWHNGDSNVSLQDYLGMTDEEFDLFVTTSDGSINEIIKKRKMGT
jgi:hypothetical protein